jgi:hypothetical protein
MHPRPYSALHGSSSSADRTRSAEFQHHRHTLRFTPFLYIPHRSHLLRLLIRPHLTHLVLARPAQCPDATKRWSKKRSYQARVRRAKGPAGTARLWFKGVNVVCKPGRGFTCVHVLGVPRSCLSLLLRPRIGLIALCSASSADSIACLIRHLLMMQNVGDSWL